MLVHGPSKICTHASSIPIDTFGSVVTGGKNNGCVKGVGVGVGVPAGAPVEAQALLAEVILAFLAAKKRPPTPLLASFRNLGPMPQSPGRA